MLAVLSIAAAALPIAARAAPVLMISVDGLRPDDVIDADRRGIAVPNLRRMMRTGAYADGVVGVLPTLTYPSHTTLITGVSPARHGIANNLTFDPTRKNQMGWYWYAQDIAAPSLWSAARAAGLRTASVHWPVSVAAPIDDNLPQIWRTGLPDDRKLMRALATPGLLDRLEAELGPYPQGIDESVEADEARVRFAAALIREKRPALTTVYLASVDHAEHASGPGSPEANAVIARNDAMIGRLVADARAAEPNLTVVVVSDHGFAPVATDVNLWRAFVDAGLVTLDAKGSVTAWEAEPWFMGGSAAIVLARPDDAASRAKVSALLARLASDPALGIAAVLDRAAIERDGGPVPASFMLAFRPGYEMSPDPTAPLVSPSRYRGMHGYPPELAAMHSSLFVDGPALARHGDLGTVDMRGIAPSLARILGVPFPSAEKRPIF